MKAEIIKQTLNIIKHPQKMKIQCDVCNRNEASVFCSSDEAALCDECDQTVHFANKIASKHQRYSLVQPSTTRFPICDICQEKRALLFCQQDRAILCKDCDIPLHTANEHTQKHNRFLLTGAQLSATFSDKRNDVNVSVTDGCDTSVPDHFKTVTKPTSVLSETTTTSVVSNCSSNNKSINSPVNSVNDDVHQLISDGSTMSSTNIQVSDYLIDTFPGWLLDDFIVDPPPSMNNPASFGFSKCGNDNYNSSEDMLSFVNVQNEKIFTSYDSTQAENLWVPQTSTAAAATTALVFEHPSMLSQNTATNGVLGYGTKQQETSAKVHRKNKRDDAFTVPQVTASAGCKRNRSFW